MDGVFTHKGCGGSFSVEILKVFTWRSPSISLTEDGLKIGVSEFRANPNRKSGGPSFVCDKCEEVVAFADMKKEAEMTCQLCQEEFPVEEMGRCRQLQCVCESCQKVLTGNKQATSPVVQKAIQYIFLGINSDIKFTKITDILSKPVNF